MKNVRVKVEITWKDIILMTKDSLKYPSTLPAFLNVLYIYPSWIILKLSLKYAGWGILRCVCVRGVHSEGFKL